MGQLATARRMSAAFEGAPIVLGSQATFAYDGQRLRIRRTFKDPRTGAVTHDLNVFSTLLLEGATFDGEYKNDLLTERVRLPVAEGVSARVQVLLDDKPSGLARARRVMPHIVGLHRVRALNSMRAGSYWRRE